MIAWKDISNLVLRKTLRMGKGAVVKAVMPDGSEQRVGLPVSRILTAATTLVDADNGATFYLNSATEFAVTLPLPVLGYRFKFLVKAAPSGASYTIITNGSANIIKGHVLSSDLNAASDGDFETSGGDTFSFVDAKAVAGDRVEFECDGTNWFASARVSVFDAATITTAS